MTIQHESAKDINLFSCLSEWDRASLKRSGVLDLTEAARMERGLVPEGFDLKACFARQGEFGWQTIAVVGLESMKNKQSMVAGGGMKLKITDNPLSDDTLDHLVRSNVEAATAMAQKFVVSGPIDSRTGAPICGTKFLAAIPDTNPETIEQTINDMVEHFGPLLKKQLGTGGDENAPFPVVRKIMKEKGFIHPQQGIIAGLERPVESTCKLMDEVCQAKVEVPLLGQMALVDMASAFTTFVSLQTTAERAGFSLSDLHVAVQGTGAIGLPLIALLEDAGVKIDAIASKNGLIIDSKKSIDIPTLFAAFQQVPPRELDIALLRKLKKDGQLPESTRILPFKRILTVEESMSALATEVGKSIHAILPCAGAHAITEGNADLVESSLIGPKLIVGGANDGVTPEAETQLMQKGVVIPPDFVVNSGVAALFGMVEDGTIREANADTILGLLTENTKAWTTKLLDKSKSTGITPRKALHI
jgi:hypothetical protein